MLWESLRGAASDTGEEGLIQQTELLCSGEKGTVPGNPGEVGLGGAILPHPPSCRKLLSYPWRGNHKLSSPSMESYVQIS